MVLAACAVPHVTGGREFMLVADSQEIQMGLDADPQISTSYGVVENQGSWTRSVVVLNQFYEDAPGTLWMQKCDHVTVRSHTGGAVDQTSAGSFEA